MRWIVLVLGACGGGGGGAISPASDAQATEVATRLAAAITTCDAATIGELLNFPYLAARAGGDATFRGLAAKESIDCKRQPLAVSVVARPLGKPPRPLLRWRSGAGCEGAVGYVELTVEAARGKHPARVADYATPLDPQTVITSLRNIQSLPDGDQPGMMSDVLHGPFSQWDGLETGSAHLLSMEFSPTAHKSDAPQDERDLAAMIARGFRARDYAAVQVAINKVAKLVGEDAQLAGLRVAAAIGDGQRDYALQLARDATTKWPADRDAWCARYDAELKAGGTTAGIDEAKQTLASKFQITK